MRRRRRAALSVLCGVIVLSTGACGDLPRPAACTFSIDDRTVDLDHEQTANAATIAAVGLRRGLSDQGIVVALATAKQESKLRNIDYGDRDSKGLFQQRPSQGWGDPDDIMDPQYAAERFYEKLEKVPDWEDLPVTEAAQAVQNSAYPDEYAKWVDDSELMTRALTGNADGALVCRVDADSGEPSMSRLTKSLLHDWGDKTVYSQSVETLTVPTDSAANGWQYASWLVAHANEHAVSHVRYQGRIWTAEDGEWSTDESSGAAGDRAVIAQLRAR